MNVARQLNGANCASSAFALGKACENAIDGDVDEFAFDSGASPVYWIKIDFSQSFLINKLRVKQLDSSDTQITNVNLEFSDASSESVGCMNLLGGGGIPQKNDRGCSSEIVEKRPIRYQNPVFHGRGSNAFLLLRGANSLTFFSAQHRKRYRDNFSNSHFKFLVPW